MATCVECRRSDMGHVDVLAYDPVHAVSAGPKTTADVPVKGGK